MTPEELDRLDALAAKATPGPWVITESLGMDEVYCEWHTVGPFDLMGAKAGNDGRFIAACDPDTIRRLVAAARGSVTDLDATARAAFDEAAGKVREAADTKGME